MYRWMIEGNMKFVMRRAGSTAYGDTDELYDLKADPQEKNNLIGQVSPVEVDRMVKQLDEWWP